VRRESGDLRITDVARLATLVREAKGEDWEKRNQLSIDGRPTQVLSDHD
jgi:hypothetical protein